MASDFVIGKIFSVHLNIIIIQENEKWPLQRHLDVLSDLLE